MAHFAKLDDNNIVIDVNVVDNATINNLSFPDSEPVGIAFLTDWSGGYSNWKQTSYNNSFRMRYAGIGFSYNSDIDAFIPPKPWPSFTLNPQTGLWDPPVPYPNDGKAYQWNEATQSWDPVDVPPTEE
jgi:hypothetical protein